MSCFPDGKRPIFPPVCLAIALLLSSGIPVLAESAPVRHAPVPDFLNDVLPVLSKAGCNSGACHGAEAGKNGFKLSLRGYDPAADYLSLTREALGRRVATTAPAHSLMLLKATMTVPHGGGRRFAVDSQDYRIVADWIAAGAPPPGAETPVLHEIAVQPSRLLIEPDKEIQLRVTASFSDGTARDVTRWTKFTTTDESVATVDDQGRVTTVGSGEAAISIWYSSLVSFARITTPFPFDLDESAFDEAPIHNVIDELVLDKLRQLRIPPSAQADDETFIRRVYLDTIGVLPEPDEVEVFLKDERPDRRSHLIGRLLEREEFIDYWTYKWSDLLLVSSRKLQRGAMLAYYAWIQQSVAQNKPWDEMVRELVTATGSNLQNGAANYFVIHKDPIDLTENLSQAFLGMSLTCARCHNHPMEKWTQNDYYGMANLLSRVALKNGEAGGEFTVISAAMGDLNHPRLGHPLPPKPLEGDELPLNGAPDRRVHLAQWLTAPENPYFARSVINRVWANFLGKGLVEPVDDMRLTNPASNEELLSALAGDFVENGYDLRRLIRTILESATYQRSSTPNSYNVQDERYYSRYVIRRLPAEVILDILSQVTQVPTRFEGFPLGLRALQLPDSQVESYFLTSFGRPPRLTTSESEREHESNLTQALHLINGETLNEKLRAEGGLLEQLLDSGRPPEAIVDEIYRRTFSRPPTGLESERLGELLNPIEREKLEDLLWALLTSKEFLFNR